MREAAVKATEDTIRNAVMFGAKAVVLHLGTAGPSGISPQAGPDLRARRFPQPRLLRAEGEGGAAAARGVQESVAAGEGMPRAAWWSWRARTRSSSASRSARTSRNFPTRSSSTRCWRPSRARSSATGTTSGTRSARRFFGWHDHIETLAHRRERLFGLHIHDCRRPQEDHLPLGHGEIQFNALLPLVRKPLSVFWN